MSKELQALEVAHRLINSFIHTARAGQVAEVSISAFADLRIIEDIIVDSKQAKPVGLYMVTYAGKPMACGSLADCWRYVKESVGDQRISALMDMNITIEPAPPSMPSGFVEAA